jgi:hypothetical protein
VLIVGAIAIHESLYAYRMHGKNKHSDGRMLGGSSQTSRKNWGPISQRVLGLILDIMASRREQLVGSIGEMRYEQSIKTLRFAMRHSTRPQWVLRLLSSVGL